MVISNLNHGTTKGFETADVHPTGFCSWCIVSESLSYPKTKVFGLNFVYALFSCFKYIFKSIEDNKYAIWD